MTEKSGTGSGIALVAILIALGSAAWGFIEHRNTQALQESVAQAELRTAKLRQDLDVLQAQLASTKRKLNETVQQKMPVTVQFQPAKFGAGLTAVFKNDSPADLPLSIQLSDPVTGHKRVASFTLEPNGLRSIGESQGWVFTAGQKMQVTNPQFGSTDYVVAAE